jgi:hypothetical protein
MKPPVTRVRFQVAENSRAYELGGFFQPIAFWGEDRILSGPGLTGRRGYALIQIRDGIVSAESRIAPRADSRYGLRNWDFNSNQSLFAALSTEGLGLYNEKLEEVRFLAAPSGQPRFTQAVGFLEQERYFAGLAVTGAQHSPRICIFRLADGNTSYRWYDSDTHRHFFRIAGKLFSISPQRIVFLWSLEKAKPISFKPVPFDLLEIDSRGDKVAWQTRDGIYYSETAGFLATVQ